MKKHSLPLLLVIIFIGIGSIQYYENYLFRTQPPSSKWSKEVKISEGRVKSSPKIINYKDVYAVAHDDGDSIRVMLINKLGEKLGEKVFPGKDELIQDLNLLTDGENIFVSWIYSSGSVNNIASIKLDKDLSLLEQWEVEDVRESLQISSSLMAVAHQDKIEVFDVNTRKSSFVQMKLPSNLTSTKTNKGYMIAFYVEPNFKYVIYNNETISEQELIMARFTSHGEMFMATAVACDDKNGYLILERKYKKEFGQNTLITFPLNVDKNVKRELARLDNYVYDPGVGVEKGFRINEYTDFTYNPLPVSSGDEARFLIGVARVYGKSQRQFDIMDFTFKDGRVTGITYIDKTREGTTMPWVNGEVAVFCNQTSSGQYDVCIASQNEEFKKVNNTVRRKEIKLALLDTLTAASYSILGLLTIGIRWILPAVFLISVATLFWYKLSNKNKKNVFLAVCIIGGILKLVFAKDLFYGVYINLLPAYLKSVSQGVTLLLIISIISYVFGFIKYKRAMDRDPDVMPLFTFILAIMVDSILTQFIYSPYIM